MTDHNQTTELHEAMTLDPPGSVAIVGAGALGIEAALYGRFLGYDVTLIEAEAIGHSLHDHRDEPLPMMPAQCLSPLAVSALDAQQQDFSARTLPITCGQWIESALVPLTETDLLSGRLRMPFRVKSITTINVESENDTAGDEQHDGPIPPDFRLQLAGVDGRQDEIDVEAVVLAIGTSSGIELDFPVPAAYFFRIGDISSGDAEQDLLAGRRQIVSVFASLAGRAELDLYRPRRG